MIQTQLTDSCLQPQRTCLVAARLLAVLFVVIATRPATASEQVTIRVIGSARVPAQILETVIGPAPDFITRQWQREAYRRVVRHYRSLGYDLVRGWWAIRERDAARIVELHIDEGQIHRTAVHGTSSFNAVMMQMEFFLPDNIFQDAVDGRVSKGKAMSLGCIRLRDVDVERLFEWISLGTRVEIRD